MLVQLSPQVVLVTTVTNVQGCQHHRPKLFLLLCLIGTHQCMADAMQNTHVRNCAQVGAMANTHLACTPGSPCMNLSNYNMKQDRAKMAQVKHIMPLNPPQQTVGHLQHSYTHLFCEAQQQHAHHIDSRWMPVSFLHVTGRQRRASNLNLLRSTKAT
jgi:hypothetical protein